MKENGSPGNAKQPKQIADELVIIPEPEQEHLPVSDHSQLIFIVAQIPHNSPVAVAEWIFLLRVNH